MKPGFILMLFLLFLLSGSCSKSEEFDFTLYTEYLDNTPGCKTIKVTIDSQPKLMDQVCYTGIMPDVETSTFPVESGKRFLRAEIIGNANVFARKIEFDASKKYGYLTFNNRTNEFNFFLSSSGGIMINPKLKDDF